MIIGADRSRSAPDYIRIRSLPDPGWWLRLSFHPEPSAKDLLASSIFISNTVLQEKAPGMPPKNPAGKTTARSTAAAETVEIFLAELDHPYKSAILALRRAILEADPAIGEEIKWNAPSFRTSEHFATMHLRAKNGVQLILHRGAKKRDDGADMTIHDPESLLAWLGDDRASATFGSAEEIQAKRPALTEIIRQWITYV